MVTAYVLVKANTGDADRLLTEIGDVEGVVDVHVVAGDVDLIVKLAVESADDVKRIVANSIQEIHGVEDTETYLTMD
ncbi:MAG: Lrp/AsnC ligand binding domain-containing protein [Halobacteriaceae archaeon]